MRHDAIDIGGRRSGGGIRLLGLLFLVLLPVVVAGVGGAPALAGEDAPEGARPHASLFPFGVRGLGGDDPATRRKAIQDGLTWLAAHQSPDGGWEAAGFHKWCNGIKASAGPDGLGKHLYDPGVTGLTLLAFLRAGYTHESRGPFARVVTKGLRYLRNVQDVEGCFGPRTSQHYIYNHGYAAAALAEAFAMTGDLTLQPSAQAGLDFIALARNPYYAWRYGVKPGDNDTSVTGTMIAALQGAMYLNKAAQGAGLEEPLRIDPDIFSGIEAWIGKMTDPDYGRTGYIQRGGMPARPQDLIDKFPGDKSESMTGIGLYARIVCGEDPRTSAVIKKGVRLCVKLPPTWNKTDGSIDLYYWYFATQALVQVGGEAWTTWDAALEKALVSAQRKDTTSCMYKGSWDPLGPWGPDGGRVYATAISLLCLEAARAFPLRFPEPARHGDAPRGSRGLIEALKDSWLDPHVRGAVIQGLALRQPSGAMEALRQALQSKEDVIRTHAARALGHVGSLASDAVPLLTKALEDPYESVRREAARALARMGEAAAPAVPALEKLLDDRSATIRRAAARALGALGSGASAGALRARVTDKDAGVRVAVARALWTIEGQAETVRPVLRKALADTDADVLHAALAGIEALGAPLDPATRQALTGLMLTPNLDVRLHAAEVLGRVAGASGLATPSGALFPAVSALVAQAFASRDLAIRRRAVGLIGRLGTAGRAFVDPLARVLLADTDGALRETAAVSLGTLGKEAKGAVAALHLASVDRLESVRKAAQAALKSIAAPKGSELAGLVAYLGEDAHYERARDALASLGPPAAVRMVSLLEKAEKKLSGRLLGVLRDMGADAMPALLRGMRHSSKTVRGSCAWTIAYMDNLRAYELAPAVPGLLKAIADLPAKVRPKVLATVAHAGTAAVPAALAALKDKKPVVRAAALTVIGRIQPPLAQVQAGLEGALKDAETDVRKTAAEAFARFGSAASGAVPALLKALTDSEEDVRAAAAAALGRVGSGAREAAPALIQAFRDDDDAVSAAAQVALRCLGPVQVSAEELPAVDALVADLGSSDAKVRRSAAAALAALGPAAKGAVDMLARALADTDAWVVSQARDALGRIGQPAVSALVAVIDEGPARAQGPAIDALGRMGSGASGSLSVLVKALEHPGLRESAADALARMGKPAASSLSRALKHDDKGVRRAAIRALGAMGPAGSSAKNTLWLLVKRESDPEVRTAALQALGGMGKTAVSTLKQALRSKTNLKVQVQVVKTLGGMGGDAKSALSKLESCLKRESRPSLRNAIAAAVPRIRTGLPNLFAREQDDGTRPWLYLDDTLPGGVGAEIATLYRFDGADGSLSDRGKAGNDLEAAVGEPQFGTDAGSGLVGLRFPMGVRLDAKGDGLRFTGAFTMEMVVRTSDREANVLSVDLGRSEVENANYLWSLRIHGGAYASLHESGNGENGGALYGIAPSGGTELITLTRDAHGRTYRLYRNGVLQSQVEAVRPPTTGKTSTQKLHLGGDANPSFKGKHDFQGLILGIRITPAMFSPEAVKKAYERVRGG